MTRNDKSIVCKDCGRTFIFRFDEQNYYAQQGYDDPVRCKECRTKKKAAPASRADRPERSAAFTSTFDRRTSNGPSPNKPFDRPVRGRDSGRPAFDRPSEREVFPAVCASCGKSTTVPFKPREGGKPVYCRDCFSKQK